MKVIGWNRSDFTTKDGTEIKGVRLHLSGPLPEGEGDGVACESVYVTDAKLARSSYTPKVGDEIVISYNGFGKPNTIIRVKA